MSIKNLKRLMYDLFYPAVLGSGLVSIAIRISAHNSTPDPYIFDRLSLGKLKGSASDCFPEDAWSGLASTQGRWRPDGIKGARLEYTQSKQ